MMKKTLVLLASCLLAGTATAQEEDNIWERPENKAVVVVDDDSDNASSRTGALKVSAGPAWITSRMYISDDSYIRNQPGFECAVSYEYIGRKGWGFTFDLNYNHTSYDYFNATSYFHLFHLGPGVVYAYANNHWRYSIELGVGMAYCREKVDTYNIAFVYSGNNQVGFGVNSRLGLEYIVTKEFGIGVDLNGALLFMNNRVGLTLKDSELYGISHSAILIGPRFYF